VQPAGAPVTVQVATLRGISDSGLFIAAEKGYFAEQGINIDYAEIGLGSDIAAMTGADQIDVGGAAVSAGLLNASARGIGIKIVADKGSNTTFLAVRKDLIDSGAYRGLSDLKGLKIALPDLVSGGMIEMDRMLQAGGLTLQDAEVISMPFPDQIPALGNRAIDAAITIEPFVSIIVAQNLATRTHWAKDVGGPHQVAVLMYSPKFAASDAARRFMVAYVKGLRDYNDAFVKQQNLDAVADMIAKYSTTKDTNLIKRVTPVDLNPDGYFDVRSIEGDMDWYTRGGHLTGRPDLTKLLDTSYLDYANQQLGRYAR
jgi:ABC-type nitrate/sulfonate/bicarbonate transport system substrate-binding protein